MIVRNINYDSDTDIFLIEIEEDGYYELSTLGDSVDVSCRGIDGGSIQIWNNRYSLYLEKGTYFLFVDSNYSNEEYWIGYFKD